MLEVLLDQNRGNLVVCWWRPGRIMHTFCIENEYIRENKYIVGTLDAEAYDRNGNVSQEAKIKLPDSIKKKVLALDKLYSESLNWDDPAGDSLRDKSQWDKFHLQTIELHKEISNMPGDDFEIIYKQE